MRNQSLSPPYRMGLLRVLFILMLLVVTIAHAQQITRLEYFFDTDPGRGNATAIPITSGTEVTVNPQLNVAGLAPGLHFLYVRACDNLGNWSAPYQRMVLVDRAGSNDTRAIVYGEYFFDNAPLFGAGIPLSITPGALLQASFTLDLTGVSNGFHLVGVRFRDNQNQWSIPYTKSIWVESIPVASASITGGEYFFDSDPGFGNGRSFTISGQPAQASFAADLSGITPGFHYLGFRTRDNAGHWGMPYFKSVYIEQTSGNLQITGVQYAIDHDPAMSEPSTIATLGPATAVDETFTVNLDSATRGAHRLYFRVRDDRGSWSLPAFLDFATLIPPDEPLAWLEYLGGSVRVRWATTPGDTISGFRVYRSNTAFFQPPFAGTLLATLDSTQTSYDDVISNDQWYYRVTAFNNLDGDQLTTSSNRNGRAAATSVRYRSPLQTIPNPTNNVDKVMFPVRSRK